MSESPNPPPSGNSIPATDSDEASLTTFTASPSLPTSVPGETQPYAEFLPRLPYLWGLENVDEWKYDMRLYLNHHGLLEFIDGTHENGQANIDVETPDSWRRRRAHAYTIIRSRIDDVLPMLLTAGLKAFEDDYTFDPQQLWNYITQYIRMPKREDTLKDRMLLFLFHVDFLYEDYDAADYLYLRRKLRDEFGIHVHPEVMHRVHVNDSQILDEDMVRGYDWKNGGLKGQFITDEGHRNWNIGSHANHEEFMFDPEDPNVIRIG